MVKKKAAKTKVKRSKPAARKAVKKVKKASSGPEVNLEQVGIVTHFFPHVNAAAIKILKNSLKSGQKVYIKGHTTDFKEKIDSMQLDHVPVAEARKGQEIGLLVKSRVRIGDKVYRI